MFCQPSYLLTCNHLYEKITKRSNQSPHLCITSLELKYKALTEPESEVLILSVRKNTDLRCEDASDQAKFIDFLAKFYNKVERGKDKEVYFLIPDARCKIEEDTGTGKIKPVIAMTYYYDRPSKKQIGNGRIIKASEIMKKRGGKTS